MKRLLIKNNTFMTVTNNVLQAGKIRTLLRKILEKNIINRELPERSITQLVG
jgi:hypothetical protein